MKYIFGGFGLRGRQPVVTVVGDSEVHIENCRRLLECNDIKCSILSAGYLVEVWGTELSAAAFAGGSASVSGKIQSVNIARRNGGGTNKGRAIVREDGEE